MKRDGQTQDRSQFDRTFSTPMMQQYMEIKKQYKDCLLLFRLGDFYELFLDDAKVGAKTLSITLTKRPRGKDGDIPMAGVPFHSADSYIAKLVEVGYKVAICEQVSEPDNKGIVEREVVRIVTPGTILDEKSLIQKKHNYVMSLTFVHESMGLAVADLSTGDFQTTEFLLKNKKLEEILDTELIRFEPSECILHPQNYHNHNLIKALKTQKKLNIYCLHEWDDYVVDAEKKLKKHFNIKSLRTFNIHKKQKAIKASAVLLQYLQHTQLGKVQHIQSIKTYSPDNCVVLDRTTITNLELFKTLQDKTKQGSLFGVLDKTHSAMGGRKLREWIQHPLKYRKEIEERLSGVEELVQKRKQRQHIQTQLKELYDIERIVSRLSTGLALPPAVINLKHSLLITLKIQQMLEGFSTNLFTDIQNNISDDIEKVEREIERVLLEDPNSNPKEGNIIKHGVSIELDDIHEKWDNAKQWIENFEKEQKEKTGITSLKVSCNKVFGYYIDVSKANIDKVPNSYIRKQTLVNSERFITKELKKYEEVVLTSEEKKNQLEYVLFTSLVEKILSYTKVIQKASNALAKLDCLCSLAQVAEECRYIRPSIVSKGDIAIEEGRHPVVEQSLEDVLFVPNNTLLNESDHQLLVITGPNMAGKSVYIRQVALITLLAHIGSFVPAKKATISLVDRIFTRTGASDVITKGLSTFMVEMVETANILHNATNKSLIIMDEIGRGTSTYDGISIAWAVAEYIVTTIHAKTLFATHYHELQTLESRYPDSIKNYHLYVESSKGEPLFLHVVKQGGASHSFGVAVAKLAGVPSSVTRKASTLLHKLENQQSIAKSKSSSKINKSLKSKEEKKYKQFQKCVKVLQDTDINMLTPLEAMEKLDKLKKVIS